MFCFKYAHYFSSGFYPQVPLKDFYVVMWLSHHHVSFLHSMRPYHGKQWLGKDLLLKRVFYGHSYSSPDFYSYDVHVCHPHCCRLSLLKRFFYGHCCSLFPRLLFLLCTWHPHCRRLCKWTAYTWCLSTIAIPMSICIQPYIQIHLISTPIPVFSTLNLEKFRARYAIDIFTKTLN